MFTAEDCNDFLQTRNLDMICIDCGEDTDTSNSYYMVQDQLWQQAVPDPEEANNHVLCLPCLERRLGRELNALDFIEAPVNKPDHVRNQLLLKRITTPPP